MINFIFKCLITIVSNVFIFLLASNFFSDILWFKLISQNPGHYIPWLIFLWILFWVINTVIWSILKIVTLPLRIISLGFFSIIVNVWLLYLFQYIVNTYIDIQYTVELWTFSQTLILSFVLSTLIRLIRCIVDLIL